MLWALLAAWLAAQSALAAVERIASVATTAELQQALAAPAAHIVVTAHLQLETDIDQDPVRFAAVTEHTQSIRVRRSSVALLRCRPVNAANAPWRCGNALRACAHHPSAPFTPCSVVTLAIPVPAIVHSGVHHGSTAAPGGWKGAALVCRVSAARGRA